MEKIFWVCLFWIPMTLNAQEYIPLEDLSFFKSTGKTNWKLAKDASADLSKKDIFTLTPCIGESTF